MIRAKALHLVRVAILPFALGILATFLERQGVSAGFILVGIISVFLISGVARKISASDLFRKDRAELASAPLSTTPQAPSYVVVEAVQTTVQTEVKITTTVAQEDAASEDAAKAPKTSHVHSAGAN